MYVQELERVQDAREFYNHFLSSRAIDLKAGKVLESYGCGGLKITCVKESEKENRKTKIFSVVFGTGDKVHVGFEFSPEGITDVTEASEVLYFDSEFNQSPQLNSNYSEFLKELN